MTLFTPREDQDVNRLVVGAVGRKGEPAHCLGEDPWDTYSVFAYAGSCSALQLWYLNAKRCGGNYLGK